MRLRTQLLLLVAAVALSPVLVSAIYAGASAVLRQRDFPLAMRSIHDDLPRVLAGEQETIDLPDGVVLTVLDVENLVLFSTGREYGPGAAVDPREVLRASRESRDIHIRLEPLFRNGELAGTFLLSVPARAIPALARPGWLGWMRTAGRGQGGCLWACLRRIRSASWTTWPGPKKWPHSMYFRV